MGAIATMSDLRQAGIELAVSGSTIRATPASILTDRQRAAIRANKSELIALLTAQAANDHGDVVALVEESAPREPAPAPPPAAAEITCNVCRHWTQDTINPSGGAGLCGIGVKGSCYPWRSCSQGVLNG